MEKVRDLHPFSVRMPLETRAWIKETAAKDRRSMNDQMVYILEQARESRIEKEKALSVPAPKALVCKSHTEILGVTREA